MENRNAHNNPILIEIYRGLEHIALPQSSGLCNSFAWSCKSSAFTFWSLPSRSRSWMPNFGHICNIYHFWKLWRVWLKTCFHCAARCILELNIFWFFFGISGFVILGASFQDLYHRLATAVELYRRYCCGIVTFGCGIVSALRNGACCNFWSFISRRFALRVSCFRVKNIIFPSLSTWLRIPWAAIMWSMLPPFTRCAKFVSSCGTSLWRSIIDISFAPKSPFESRYNCRVQQRGWDNAPDLHLSIHIIHSWQRFEGLCSNVPALSIQKQDSLCNTE